MNRPRPAVALALLASTALAGCGAASGAGHGTTAHVRASATVADAAPTVHVSAGLRRQEARVHRQVTAALRSGADGSGGYGTLPRDLRGHQAAPRDQVLSAGPGHPAQPIAGVAVRLHLGSGASVLALGVGPYVPVADQGSFHNQTPATWRVTFSDVHGTVPLKPSMFTLTDEQGKTLTPRASVLGGGTLPSSVPAGRTLTVVLAARTSIGSGNLYYTPTGHHALVAWQFDAETD